MTGPANAGQDGERAVRAVGEALLQTDPGKAAAKRLEKQLKLQYLPEEIRALLPFIKAAAERRIEIEINF